MRQKALDILRKLGWRAGDTVYVALDDTQQRKRGKKMDAVKKLFLHAEKVYAPAHIFVTCVLIYRGVVIPYAVRLWLPKEFSSNEGVPFQKLTEMAAEMLAQLALPGKGKVIAGTLEMSNVDLAHELTSLITTQRAYEANSKVITTSDDVLQTLVNLKR